MRRFAKLTTGGLALIATAGIASADPAWWAARGVTNGAQKDDYAVVNQGQLKNIATQAYNEIVADAPGGAGTVLQGIINGWRTPTLATEDYSAATLGGAKNLKTPFYNRLAELGLVSAYPWSAATVPADDFATANIGQVKYLFNFDPSGGIWSQATIPSWWSLNLFGTTNIDPYADYTGSGLTNLQKYHQGINPLPWAPLAPIADPTQPQPGPPSILKLNGDNQSGAPSQVLTLPLQVQAWAQDGVSPLVGFPIKFVLPQSSGATLFDTGRVKSSQATLVINTDLNGIAQVLLQLPGAPFVYTTVTAVGTGAGPVQFSEVTTQVPGGSQLVAEWKLNEMSGSSAGDSTARGNTASLTHSAWVTNSFEGVGALQFNGGARMQALTAVNSGGQLFAIPPGSQNAAPFSIALWFRLPQSLSDGAAYTLFYQTGAFRCTLDEDFWAPGTSGLLRARFWSVQDGGNADLNSNPSYSTITPGTTEWHHLAVTYDGATAVLYIDGLAAAQQAGSNIKETASPFIAGQGLPGTFSNGLMDDFLGVIDDVQIYGVALQPQAITTIYNTPGVDSNGYATGIPAWWQYKYFGKIMPAGSVGADGQPLSLSWQNGTDPTQNHNRALQLFASGLSFP